MRNYSGRGWEGQHYDRNLDIKEIAKILRKNLKDKYPKTKFSITIERYRMGQSMSVSVLESDIQIMKDPLAKHEQVNQYYIKQSDLWTDEGKALLEDVYQMACGYNYDDSDSMTDYFDTNFYLHLAVGKWDKPFVCTDPNQVDPQSGISKAQMQCDLLNNVRAMNPLMPETEIQKEWGRLSGMGFMQIKNMYVMNLG